LTLYGKENIIKNILKKYFKGEYNIMDKKVVANGIVKVEGLGKMVGVSDGKDGTFMNSLPPPPPNSQKVTVKPDEYFLKEETRSPHPYTPPTEGNLWNKDVPHLHPKEGNYGKGQTTIKSGEKGKRPIKKGRFFGWTKVLIAVVLIGLIGGIAGYFLTRDKGIVPIVLGIPNGLEINDKILTWEEVDNAKSYIIDIDGEEYKADEAEYSLDKLIEIKVYEIKIKAIGNGEIYFDSEWSEIIKYTVSMNLNAPSGLEIDDKILTWGEVENAESYIIDIDGMEKTSENANYSLDELVDIKIYEIKIKAIGDGEIYFDSDWSEVVKYTVSTNLTAPNGLQIIDKTLTWDAVPNAASYTVWINEAEKGTVDGTEYFLEGLEEMTAYEFKIKAIGDGIIYFDSDLIAKYLHIESADKPSTANLSFTLIEGDTEYSVAYGTATDLDIVIPPTYDGKLVKEIAASAFYNQQTITSVFIPNSIETIGNSAFSGCAGLTGDLVIPNSVISIGIYAFRSCNGFKGNLVIGNSVETIWNYAFSWCTGLTGDLTIPDSVETIGNNAFYDCSGFKGNLTIGNSVETIGGMAFQNCSGLTGDLVIPNSVITIGNQAFTNCSGFKGNLVIGNSVTSIEGNAFRECSGLTGDLVIGNSVTTIGLAAFSGCFALTNIVIPNSVTSIGIYAFNACSVLKSITIPFVGNTLNGTNNTHFGYIFGASVYGDNSSYVPFSLKTVIIGGTSIKANAFYGCSYLESIEISDSVTTIGDRAFAGCSGLRNVTVNRSISAGGVTKLEGSNVFYNCNALTNIYVPANSVSVYRGTQYWSTHTNKIKAIQ
jgi:hypothetical protein